MQDPLYRLGRRGFLQASAAGVVAAGLPALSRTASADPGTGRAKTVLFVHMSGGLRGPKPGVGSRDFAPLFHDVHLHPQIPPPQAVQPSSLVLGIRELWVVCCVRPAYD